VIVIGTTFGKRHSSRRHCDGWMDPVGGEIIPSFVFVCFWYRSTVVGRTSPLLQTKLR